MLATACVGVDDFARADGLMGHALVHLQESKGDIFIMAL